MDDVSLAEMMAPIAGDRPAGGDPRAFGAGSDLYLAAKDERGAARTAEREALAAADPDVDPLAAGLRSWTAVARDGAALLASHAKDLQVAAWIVEAWVRTDGLAGLADGVSLLAELVEGYWDDGLFPAADEDGVETRVAPLFGLFGREEAGTLVQPIKLLPLTDGAEHVALWTIEAARRQPVRQAAPDPFSGLVTEGGPDPRERRAAALEAAIAGASPGFVAASLDAIDRATAEIDRLMAAVDRLTPFGRFGSQVTAPLDTIAALLRQAAPRAVSAAAPVTAAAETAAATPAAGAVDMPPQQKTLDRAAALATLLDVAGFFDRTEPQSLIGRGLRDIVRRARLPLEELLAELIPDRDQRVLFMLRAGIQPPRDEGGMTSY